MKRALGTDESEDNKAREEAIAVLRNGVREWNSWVAEKRKSDPSFRPNLRGVDFCHPAWRKTPLWRKTDAHVRNHSEPIICLFEEELIVEGVTAHLSIEPIDFKNADLVYARFDGTGLFQANLQGAYLEHASFENAYLSEANLERADLGSASLKGADLTLANLTRSSCTSADFSNAFVSATNLEEAFLWWATFEGAFLGHAQFNRADCSGINIERADLREADFSHADVSDVEYKLYKGWPFDTFPFNQGFWPIKRNLMLGKYLGIRGVDSCYGNPIFRRNALDQDFIDSIFENVKLITYHGITVSMNRWFSAILNSKWGMRIRRLLLLPTRLHYERIPGRLLFALWGFFDYGRSILSLLIFASLIIGTLGFWYQNLEASGAIGYGGNLTDVTPDAGLLYKLRPWFAALMGFATLGLTDLIAPHNWRGALAMALNVLAGFVTLGLFLAVFQNKFARRS